jgi:hypothetical protein
LRLLEPHRTLLGGPPCVVPGVEIAMLVMIDRFRRADLAEALEIVAERRAERRRSDAI